MTHNPRPQRRTRRQSRELLLVSLVAGAAVVVLLVVGFWAARSGRRPRAPAADADRPSATAPGTSGTRPPGIGDPVRDGKFEFVVSRVDCSHKSIGIEHFQRTAKGRYCVVSLTVRNIAGTPKYFVGHAQKAVTADGGTYRDDDIAAVYVNHDTQTFLRKLTPGRRVTGKLVFDVPATTRLTGLELHDSLLSGGVEVTLG
jgi:hypothetical protein